MNMNLNPGYMIYQAEHPRSYAEQRAADELNGKLAASLARWARPLGLLRRARSGHPQHRPATVNCGQVSSRAA
ncbi:MAG TPA: hypothetical protein VFB06_18670 [Streptosporangiaceae bacterium]|nr:hypothetical protein [Streptosporangiaceae bacterium]